MIEKDYAYIMITYDIHSGTNGWKTFDTKQEAQDELDEMKKHETSQPSHAAIGKMAIIDQL